jgi:putative phosphoribosyl transferase
MFRDRFEAGTRLAQRLEPNSTTETLLLAIPRGGIEVAYPIALHLRRPLDVIIPRKITFPDNPELAIGAVTFDGSVEINQPLVEKLNLSSADVDELVRPARLEIERRLAVYRREKPSPQLEGKDVVLIDDGLATGYTMMAAVKSVRREKPRQIIVAVPVSPVSTAEHLQSMVDQIMVLHLAQESFFAVGAFYDRFNDLSDAELIRLLEESNVPFQKSAQSGNQMD